MKKEGKLIIWGLLLTTFHISIGSLQLMPPFVGMFLILYGAYLMLEQEKCAEYSKACILFLLWAVLSVAGDLLAFSGKLFRHGYLLSTVLLLCEYLGYYYLFAGAAKRAKESAKRKLEGYQKWISVGLAVAGVTNCVGDVLYDQGWIWLTVAVLLITRFSVGLCIRDMTSSREENTKSREENTDDTVLVSS